MPFSIKNTENLTSMNVVRAVREKAHKNYYKGGEGEVNTSEFKNTCISEILDKYSHDKLVSEGAKEDAYFKLIEANKTFKDIALNYPPPISNTTVDEYKLSKQNPSGGGLKQNKRGGHRLSPDQIENKCLTELADLYITNHLDEEAQKIVYDKIKNVSAEISHLDKGHAPETITPDLRDHLNTAASTVNANTEFMNSIELEQGTNSAPMVVGGSEETNDELYSSIRLNSSMVVSTNMLDNMALFESYKKLETQYIKDLNQVDTYFRTEIYNLLKNTIISNTAEISLNKIDMNSLQLNPDDINELKNNINILKKNCLETLAQYSPRIEKIKKNLKLMKEMDVDDTLKYFELLDWRVLDLQQIVSETTNVILEKLI